MRMADKNSECPDFVFISGEAPEFIAIRLRRGATIASHEEEIRVGIGNREFEAESQGRTTAQTTGLEHDCRNSAFHRGGRG